MADYKINISEWLFLDAMCARVRAHALERLTGTLLRAVKSYFPLSVCRINSSFLLLHMKERKSLKANILAGNIMDNAVRFVQGMELKSKQTR